MQQYFTPESCILDIYYKIFFIGYLLLHYTIFVTRWPPIVTQSHFMSESLANERKFDTVLKVHPQKLVPSRAYVFLQRSLLLFNSMLNCHYILLVMQGDPFQKNQFFTLSIAKIDHYRSSSPRVKHWIQSFTIITKFMQVQGEDQTLVASKAVSRQQQECYTFEPSALTKTLLYIKKQGVME